MQSEIYPQTMLECQPSISNYDMDTTNETNNEDQGRIRRRAPTRHSIKSLSSRKTLTKQASLTEVK